MKRIASSDCKDGDDRIYSKEFRALLDGLDEDGGCIDEASPEKKRRLTADQVRALEKNFEVENKLEPERKVKLAFELGVQPRQVAVWFQNRRARWKTKQLERDYGALKADFDGLKLSCEKLKLDNDSLLKEIKELKEKLSSGEEDGKTSQVSAAKEDEAIVASDERTDQETAAATEMEIVENFSDGNLLGWEFKDGSSDSDSASAVLNSGGNEEDNSNSPRAAAADVHHHNQFLGGGATVNFHVSSLPVGGGNYEDFYFVKIEEQSFLDEESGANLMFSDDEAPSLPWICSDEWK